MKKLLNYWGGILTLLFCGVFAHAQSPSTVLVVANANNRASIKLALYYLNARHIPTQNLCLINWQAADNADTCTLSAFTQSIAEPIYAQIRNLPQIDYIVLCRNLPSKIQDATCSVDSALASHGIKKRSNPYYLGSPGFRSKNYGMQLVTRLDGWSWEDARALVDHAQQARRGNFFFLDRDPTKDQRMGYAGYNIGMQSAANLLFFYGFPAVVEKTMSFVAPTQPLDGYYSWGSNDSHFVATRFGALRFSPGALAETLVSTSAMFLRQPGPTNAQSQIAQLIHNGVTG
ncbi:MAG: TIGR03790 family protein, partial [Chthonomonadaceae bacterium]|nr:TIGR03790 family protein [Chthonomonadaceae bacterium]